MKKQKKRMKKRPTALKHLEKRIAVILAGGHETPKLALAALEATHVKWYHDAYGNVMKRMEKANEV